MAGPYPPSAVPTHAPPLTQSRDIKNTHMTIKPRPSSSSVLLFNSFLSLFRVCVCVFVLCLVCTLCLCSKRAWTPVVVASWLCVVCVARASPHPALLLHLVYALVLLAYTVPRAGQATQANLRRPLLPSLGHLG